MFYCEIVGGGYQGDMLFPQKSGTTRGVGSIGAPRRWPNRIIPYDISAISGKFSKRKEYLFVMLN